jgi:GT2 family glycosyltransferase
VSLQKAAVLITCHNRRALTLASLDMLFRQRSIGDLEIEVFLVDDGCADGTGDAVRARFPCVHVLRGNGSLYWNGGMRLALAVAMKIGFDAYIFLNDDTILFQDALERLVSVARDQLAAGTPSIIVGTTRSPLTGDQSFGGLRRQMRGLRVLFEPVTAHPSESIDCDTMHGNFVLIPAEVAARLGNLDDHFQHQFGDLDYGLRAKAAGFSVMTMPGYAGDCDDNPVAGTWRDCTLPFTHRWRHLISPKGVPIAEWTLFARRHFGWRWLLYALSPYVRTLAPNVFSRVSWTRSHATPAFARRSL